jgi:hypothetical protein
MPCDKVHLGLEQQRHWWLNVLGGLCRFISPHLSLALVVDPGLLGSEAAGFRKDLGTLYHPVRVDSLAAYEDTSPLCELMSLLSQPRAFIVA